MRIKKYFPLLLFSFLLLSCSASNTNDGNMSLTIQNSLAPAGLNFESLPTFLHIETFHVTVTAEDLNPSIEAYFPVEATNRFVAVPPGVNRTILFEALNSEGKVIRRRKLENVTIYKDKITPIVAAFLTVPVLTNVSDNNLITQTRLIFKGYAEPSSLLEIEDNFKGTASLLTDVKSKEDFVIPGKEDGSFTFSPQVLELGTHTFTIRDPGSGEESQITLTLVPPGQQPGTGFSDAVSSFNNLNLGSPLGFSQTIEQIIE